MIFVINSLKYDTTKMELISTKCEYKYTGTMLNMTLRYSGKNVKIFKSLRNAEQLLSGIYQIRNYGITERRTKQYDT